MSSKYNFNKMMYLEMTLKLLIKKNLFNKEKKRKDKIEKSKIKNVIFDRKYR